MVRRYKDSGESLLLLGLVAGLVSCASALNLFPTGAPSAVFGPDGASAITVGVRFDATASASITAVRYYYLTGDIATTHVGGIYDLQTQALLASATFAAPTVIGWQEVVFNSPVPIEAGKSYIAAVFNNAALYTFTANFFTGDTIGPLVTRQGSGRFLYCPNAPCSLSFPTQSATANFWVDITFALTTDTTPPLVTSVGPAQLLTGAYPFVQPVLTFSEPVNSTTVNPTTVILYDATTNATVTTTLATQTNTVTIIPSTLLSLASTYRILVLGVADLAGNPLTPAYNFVFNTLTTLPSFYNIFTTEVPAGLFNDNQVITVGTVFSSDVEGSVDRLRFFKLSGDTGNHTVVLYDKTSQTALSSSLSVGETASGWQTVQLSAPVSLVVNQQYVAALFSSNGQFVATTNFFTAERSIPPGYLRTYVNSGVYKYCTAASAAQCTPEFPNQLPGTLASSYFVDVYFSPTTSVVVVPPNVTSVFPSNNTLNVPRIVTPSITFSKAINPSLVTPSSIQLRVTSTGVPVSATLSLSVSFTTVTITPVTILGNSTTYTILISETILGTQAPFLTTFTTAVASGADIFNLVNSGTPAGIENDNTGAVGITTGVEFASDSFGYVDAIRFYRLPADTATSHVVILFDAASRSVLAQATYVAPGSGLTTGWQTVLLDGPVQINPAQRYIAAVWNSAGWYAYTNGYFTANSVTSPLQTFPSSGVYVYSSAPTFPTDSYVSGTPPGTSYYWVDVFFSRVGSDVIAPRVTAFFPPTGTLDVARSVQPRVTFSEGILPSTVTALSITLLDPTNAVVPVTLTQVFPNEVTIVPQTLLANATQYTIVVSTDITDLVGNPLVTSRIATFTTTGGILPCDAPANRIVAENCLNGTPEGTWYVGQNGPLYGFATDISYNIGETVSFKTAVVSGTVSAPFTIRIYRQGYYQGNGARLVATVDVPTIVSQPRCFSDSTRIYDCSSWSVTANWSIPLTAVSGLYVANLAGYSLIPFVVRDDNSTADVVFATPDTTWQAYNDFGSGSDATGGTPGGSLYNSALAVSYNRPFGLYNSNGPDWFYQYEYRLIRWLELNGFDVTYVADIDLARAGQRLLQHKIYLSVGHDEYWSAEMRTAVEVARDSGVHLAFFSSNEIYWKVRWEADHAGVPFRNMICYKTSLDYVNRIDPNPNIWTGQWRDLPGAAKDGYRPENGLSGVLFSVDSGSTRTITVYPADARKRFWRNTAVAGVTSIYTLPTNSLGYEWDEDRDNGFRPAGLFHISTTIADVSTYYSDVGIIVGPKTNVEHNMCLYKAPSGALVFGSGSMNIIWTLDPTYCCNGQSDVNVQQAIINLFADMGVQPKSLQPGLTRAFPSTDFTVPYCNVSCLSVNGTRFMTINGTALDFGGGVIGGVEISYDGGSRWHPARGEEAWSYSFTTTNTTLRVACRAVDDSGNLGPISPTYTLATSLGTNCVVSNTTVTTLLTATPTPTKTLSPTPPTPTTLTTITPTPASPTPTPTTTLTPTPASLTPTPTATPLKTQSSLPSRTPRSSTPTPTPTLTLTPTPATPTPTPTLTPTPATPTSTPTLTPTPATPTLTPTPTRTFTPATPTPTLSWTPANATTKPTPRTCSANSQCGTSGACCQSVCQSVTGSTSSPPKCCTVSGYTYACNSSSNCCGNTCCPINMFCGGSLTCPNGCGTTGGCPVRGFNTILTAPVPAQWCCACGQLFCGNGLCCNSNNQKCVGGQCVAK